VEVIATAAYEGLNNAMTSSTAWPNTTHQILFEKKTTCIRSILVLFTTACAGGVTGRRRKKKEEVLRDIHTHI
jgi:hypothetical protein